MVRRYCHKDLYVGRLPKHAGPVLHALTGRHVLHGQGGSGQQRHPNQRHHVATLKQQKTFNYIQNYVLFTGSLEM